MSRTFRQQECPRRAEAAPQAREAGDGARPARSRQRRGVELDMPRVLSAGTFALAVASAAVLMLSGCASMGRQVPAAEARGADAVGLSASVQTTPVSAQWWRQFGDATLDGLVDKALAGSPSLAAAGARVRQAQAVADAVRGSEAPQVALDASVTRERLTENGLFPPPYGGGVFNNSDIHLGLGWDADLFGRTRNELRSALGQARAAQADADVAAQQLAVAVVRTYLQLARLDSQREVATRTLEQRTQMLSLIDQRVKAGLDTVVEQLEGEGAIPDTRTQIEALDEQITLARHQLAALTAQPMDALDGARPTLAQLHAVPQPTVIGADLLARRPDIAAARARVEAAGYEVQSQKAAFYPDINLSASFGLSSLSLGNIGEWASRAWTVGPALHLPIFEGGTLRAQLRGKNAQRDAAVDAYNETVIDAVREAADAASSSASIARQQAQQSQALASAEGSYRYSQQRYAQGLGNQLVVLNAETQVLAQRRADVDLRWRALDVQAQLMKALGGGWSDAAAAAAPAASAAPTAAGAPAGTPNDVSHTPA
jgi:NodT family efflux transporter outer membrane factor (OMF) lipoprotein